MGIWNAGGRRRTTKACTKFGGMPINTKLDPYHTEVLYIVPGAQILTDSWRACNSLPQYGYIHFQVNHQRFYVHRHTRAHTQHIDRAGCTYKEEIY